ncbi:MAG: DsbA family protein [Bryobacteraceae bacterium]
MKRLSLKPMCVLLTLPLLLAAIGAGATARAKSLAAAKPAAVGATITGKSLGSKSAPITMEIFEDFQCPACGNFYETSLKQVIDNYVSTGKVFIQHRDFPLEMHPYARQAARFANAAAALGMFEPVERALFDTQAQWGQDGKIDQAIASEITPAQIKKIHAYEAAHSAEIDAAIESDRALGAQRNVNQTPTIFVTARGKMEGLPGGGVDYKLLSSYLDYLLRQ